MKRIRLVSAIALLGLAAAPLRAQVTNGGFESGMTGWSLSGNCGEFVGVDIFARSGTFAFSAGNADDPCNLTQTIPTLAGSMYTFSFWLENSDSPTADAFNTFEVLFGNQSLFATANALKSGYTLKSYDVTATGASTTLEFRFRNDQAFWDLDDVSVTALSTTVPEPSTVALMATGLLGLAAAHRRRRRRA